MRKIKKLIITLLLLALSVISNNTFSNAAQTTVWSFNGTITPKYEFMVGEIPMGRDFVANGTLTNGIVTYDAKELTIATFPDKLTQASKDKKISVSIFKDVDSNKQIEGCNVDVSIVVNEFNPTLKCDLDGKEFVVDKMYWKSEDGFETHSYIENLQFNTTNVYGRLLRSQVQYLNNNNNNLYLGYNYFKYKVLASDEIGNKYNPAYGTFTVKYTKTPHIAVGKTSFSISVHKNKYRVLVNGKVQKNVTVKNLKSKTVYDVIIQQIKTKNGCNVEVWSGTIKTK